MVRFFRAEGQKGTCLLRSAGMSEGSKWDKRYLPSDSLRFLIRDARESERGAGAKKTCS